MHVVQTFARLVTSDGLGVHSDEPLLRRYGKRRHADPCAMHTIREKGLTAALRLKKAKEGTEASDPN